MLEVGQKNMSDYGYLGQCENSVLKESISHNSFSNFRYAFIIITQARLRQAAGQSATVNHVRFYTFVGPWVISVS